MKILAFDTSVRRLSLALSEDEKVLAENDIDYRKDLADEMSHHIGAFLKKSGCALEDLDAIVAGLGPGSFTGLRIGVSTAKALAFSLNVPVVGIPSLDAVAGALAQEAADICVLVDARRELFYAGIYKSSGGALKRSGDHLLAPLEDVLNVVSGKVSFCGDGIPLAKETVMKKEGLKPHFADKKYWLPQARYLIAPALARLKKDESDDVATLVPIYLYPEDCQVRP